MSEPVISRSPEASDFDQRWSPWSLLHAARKSWALIAVLTGAVALGMTFYTLGQTKIYETSATILFDPRPPRPLGKDVDAVVELGGSSGYFGNREYYTTQRWIIMSRRIAEEVVRELALHQDPTFMMNASARPDARGSEVSVTAAADALISRLNVEQLKDSRLAKIVYRDADPQRAQRIVSTLTDVYVRTNLDDVLISTNSAADWLQTQASTLKTDLEKSEMALFQYKKDKNILSVALDDQSNMLREEMRQLNSVLTQVRAKREQVASRNAELAKVSLEEPTNLPVSELLASPTLKSLREAYIEAARECDALAGSGKGGSHPVVQATVARKEASKTAILAEVKNIINSTATELAGLSSEINGLQRLFDGAQTRALELNLLEIEYNRLKRSKENNEKLFSLLMDRSKETDLARMLRVNNIQIVERPVVPRRPVTPNVPVNIVAGVLIGLALGLGGAIGREQMDRSIKTPDDAERSLNLAFLGLLPTLGTSSGERKRDEKKARRRRSNAASASESPPTELIVHQRPTSGIAEAARSIRTNILFMSPDRPYRTLLVTSAGPAEGKTTVACCIATAMAQAGRRVVLMDCDMRRPRLHRVFGLGKEEGITTALLDLTKLDSVVHATEVPNLSIIPTGPLPPNPAELLHSEAFARLIAMLRDKFDCVVIDSPPIVPVTDAAVLSTVVDGTVLIVRSFKTSRDLGQRAVRAVRDVGGHLVGVVLNAVSLEGGRYGSRDHYYYYYKREGYGDDVGDQDAGKGNVAEVG